MLHFAIVQARSQAPDHPIGHNLTYLTEEAPPGKTVLNFRPEARSTWRMWYDVANGLLDFIESYEYVEFQYRVQNDEGFLIGSGEFADFVEAQST